MRKFWSYVVAALLGCLAVAPPIPYNFNIEVNSFLFTYLVVIAALISFYLFTQKIDVWLKIFLIYFFADCFISQVPFISFTAYLVAVQATLFFLVCLYIDFEPVLQVLEAVFWLQIVVAIMQHAGRDTLMSFGFPDKTVYFGTVFQQMRLGSLFAIMAPFLLLKNKWYIIPLAVVALALGTLGFTFALAGGFGVYVLFMVKGKKEKVCLILWALLFCAVAADSNNHIHIELIEGRWPMWGLILKTWVLDTSKNFHGFNCPFNPSVQTGPFDWVRFLFGHGPNTFNTMFPFYKYDQNAFRPAHNDWLQTPWELGLLGAALEDSMLFGVFYMVWKKKSMKSAELIRGMVIIAINRFLSFPDHMTQTNFLMVAFIARCYRFGIGKENALVSQHPTIFSAKPVADDRPQYFFSLHKHLHAVLRKIKLHS